MSGSRWKMYFALFAALALAYVAWVTWAVASSPSESASASSPLPPTITAATRTRSRPEQFTDRPAKGEREVTDEAHPVASSAKTLAHSDPAHESMYARRLHVLRVFDAVFKRKASGDELEKYSAIGTDAERMRAIVTDYDDLRHDQAPTGSTSPELPQKARKEADEHVEHVPAPMGGTVMNAADVAAVGGDGALLLLSDEHAGGAGAPRGAAPLSASTVAAGRKAAPVAELALGERVSLNRADLVQRLQRASSELAHLHQLVHLM